ncbi:MAG: DMT family transporter [Clostridiales Family XIII bacterium]|jgi:drug/metabolite transporter (DMT)-like permease|nr:DMT family transporter [Clostridiales Family XIII bacterium]
MEKTEKMGYIKYIAALLIMSTNGIVASFIPMNSYEIVFFRLLIGSLFILTIFLMTGGKFTFFKHKKDGALVILAGISTAANLLFLFEAYVQLGVSLALIIYYVAPIVVVIISPFVFKENLTAIKIGASIAVLIGMILVSGQAMQQGKPIWGLICALLTATAMVCNLICLRKSEKVVGMEKVTIQLLVAFVTVGAFVGIKQGFAFEIHASFIVPLLIMGFINGGVALYFYFSAFTQIPAQSVAILSYTEPLAGVLLSAVFLGERLSFLQLIGGALIIGGAMAAELYHKKSGAEVPKSIIRKTAGASAIEVA